MIRRPPRAKRTDTLFPYTTLFRSGDLVELQRRDAGLGRRANGHQRRTDDRAGCLHGIQLARRTERHDLLLTVEDHRSEEHTSELQSLMRISYAVFCLKKNNTPNTTIPRDTTSYN